MKHRPARYLFDHLKEMGTETIVNEAEYTDGAYLDDYAHFYVKSFAPYRRRCRRLHFFRRPFLEVELLRWALGGESAEPFQRGYLGFVVVRPLPQTIIGRTVLATYPDDGGRRHYPVVSPYEAHLFGSTPTVRSLAFQEQDTVLAACATVALWSAFQKCAEVFGTARPSPAEITAMATTAEVRSRALPSRGLTLGQMCRAIKEVGLEPEVFECSASTPLNSLLYSYVSWGLPAVLIVDVEGRGHAITLADYSLRPERGLEREDMVAESPVVRRIGLRIDEWYGHDDQIGPFAHIFARPYTNKKKPAGPVVAFDGSWPSPTVASGFAKLVPQHVIIPVYHKIRVSFLDVQKWIAAFNLVAEKVIVNFKEFEWNVRLTTTNELKQGMRERPQSAARDRILLNPGPRFLWHAVLQTPARPVAELLIDATDMERSYPFLDVYFHDDELRANLRRILDFAPLQGVLDDLVTPQFRVFLKDRTQ